MRERTKLRWIVALGLLLSLSQGSPLLAAEAGPTAVAQGLLNSADGREGGHYHLRRLGNRVTASLVGQGIPEAVGEVLFVVPEGFRPSAPVEWETTVHASMASGSASGDFRNLETDPDGNWAVYRKGTTVTASFSSPRSPVQYHARENRQPQFVLPAGFRPAATVTHTVTGVRVNADRTAVPNAPPAVFDLIIGTNGEMHYVDNARVDGLGYVRFSVLQLSWEAGEGLAAAEDSSDGASRAQSADDSVKLSVQVLPTGTVQLSRLPAPESALRIQYATHITWITADPLLSTAGPFRDWHVPWHFDETEGMYFLERRGSQVWMTLMARHPFIAEAARIREPLFAVPEGLRPARPVVRPWMDGDGNQFEIVIKSDGEVTYGPSPLNADGSPLSNTVFGYHARLGWTTAEPARLVAAGDFVAQPVPGAGGYRLERQSDTVVAYLEATAAPVPPWVRPSPSRPQASVRSQSETYSMDLDVKSLPYRKGATLGVLEPGSQSLFYLLGRSTGYMQGPPYEWQIRWADDTAGWVNADAVQTHGEISEVPVTSRLFQVPEGFRPAQAQVWSFEARSVDDRGQDLPTPGREELAIQVSSDGLVTYASDEVGSVPGYRAYSTKTAWPAGTDFCYRSEAIQKAILRALRQTDRHSAACARITWSDLARIQTLEVTARDLQWEFARDFGKPFQRFLPHDLSGLIGLQHLRVENHYQVYDGQIGLDLIPPLFLAHVPQLRELSLQGVTLTQLPSDFLIHTPQLQHLSLTVAGGAELPAGFLSFAPHLRTLKLHLDPGITQLPAGFLARISPLQHLSLDVSPEVLAQLPRHLFTAVSHLETLHLRISWRGTSYLPSGFLQHAPQLREAVIWKDSAPYGGPSYQLILVDSASFLSHAPQLRSLWLHRVDAGSQFVHGLPDASRIHWVPRDSALFPPVAILAQDSPRSWLHADAHVGLPEDYPPVPGLLNLRLGMFHQSRMSDATKAWLFSQELRAIVLDLSSDSRQWLEDWATAQRAQMPSHLTLLLDGSGEPLPKSLLAGQSYIWLHLQDLAVSTLSGDFFADFTAAALLLEPSFEHVWRLPMQQMQLADLRHLLHSPRARHLGLRLYMAGMYESLPAGLLGDLDFTCLELDLTPTQPQLTYEALRPWLDSQAISLSWQAREERADSMPSWDSWNEGFRMRIHQPTWFEVNHIPWAREQGCRRSLYLRIQSATVALSPQTLTPTNELRHVRLTYDASLCPDCPVTLEPRRP